MTSSDRPWWRDAVVVQIYVRSFADGNGDGIGDLAGITDRLDHLARLGAEAIWLTPCFPSPQLDHGYDVANYVDIEPDYGDLAAFDRLVAEARERNIKVLMDIVPNHCSSDHAWFQAALAAAPGSAERARFWFRDGRGDHGELPPNNWRAVFGGPAWHRVTEADGTPGQWYLQTFTPWQPDWNWDNPDVQQMFEQVLEFWFDRGVEGFRVDAVAVVGKEPGLPDAPPAPAGTAETDVWAHNPFTVFWPSAHEHWRRWRRFIDDYERRHPGRELVTVSEAYTPGRPDLLLQYVTDEFHASFCFDLLLAPWVAPLIRRAIADVVDAFEPVGASLTWTLNNHDAQRSVTRYGRANATDASSFTGNNLVYVESPVDVEVGTRRARAMSVFAAALPGSLYLYYGEELGLPEVLDIPADRRQDPIFVRTEGREIGRDGCRIPMPWDTDPATSFGFSPTRRSGDDGEPWMPQPDDWGRWSVAAQAGDPASTLSLTIDTLRVRRTLDRASSMSWVVVPADANGARSLAFERDGVLVVLNTGADPLALDASLVAGRSLALSSVHGHVETHVVPADGAVWLR
jgi:alpha-glucosidase